MTFPTLNTGAVLQYPTEREIAFRTTVLRFADGSEQRYSLLQKSLKRWLVRLDQLAETEIRAVQDFFSSMQGSASSFSFEDPHDGAVYADCSLESDVLEVRMNGDVRTSTMLVIRENP